MAPDGRAATVAAGSGIHRLPEGWSTVDQVVAHITDALATVMARMRTRVDASDKTDLVTQDLFLQATADLEKRHWMWQAEGT